MCRLAELSINWNQYVPDCKTMPDTSTGSGKVILVALFHVSALALLDANRAAIATRHNTIICNLCDFIFSPLSFELTSRTCGQGRDPVSCFAATTRQNQTLSFET